MTQNTTQSTADGSPAVPPLPPPEERRRLREARSMTEKQVASAVGVSRATIRSWEAGRTTPRGRKAESYAKLLAALDAELREKAARTEREARRAAMERSAARQQGTSSAPQSRSRAGRTPAPPKAAWPAVQPSPSVQPSRDPATARPPAGSPMPMAPRAPLAPSWARTGTEPRARARTGTTTGTGTQSTTPGTGTTSASGKGSGGETGKGRKGSGTATRAGTSSDGTGTGTSSDSGSGSGSGSGLESRPLTPEQAFDALYTFAAPSLVRQAYLLTGRHSLSQESVERAFRLAWQRWPEVAVDRDPVGWIRAAAHEYALSPWHRMRRSPKRPDTMPGEQDTPARKLLREALLSLPPSYRRTLLLYDGLGLDLPDTAAETEASTPAAASRVTHAREAVAAKDPELTDTELLHERLGVLTEAVPAPKLTAPRTVRTGCERRSKLWTRVAIAFTALIVGATSFTLATAPTRYEAPQAPGEQIGDVPVPSGPQRLSKEDRKLRDKLHSELTNGPPRLVPEPF
ncbi:helix-turn-helix domain-containing protein [Streptomyces sp. NPDC056672]|uniref:helix-turn-helix domain-containing protein n=1 Tax=Streptomyces sp. NPDC056672 TaxID=3345906 RepID=UPI0036AF492C